MIKEVTILTSEFRKRLSIFERSIKSAILFYKMPRMFSNKMCTNMIFVYGFCNGNIRAFREYQQIPSTEERKRFTFYLTDFLRSYDRVHSILYLNTMTEYLMIRECRMRSIRIDYIILNKKVLCHFANNHRYEFIELWTSLGIVARYNSLRTLVN